MNNTKFVAFETPAADTERSNVRETETPAARLAPLDPKRLKRNPLFTRASWVLLAALLATGAFALGARSKQSSSSGFPAGLPAGIPAGLDLSALLGGAGGGGGSTSSAQLRAASTSSGEIILKQNGKIYVKLADGSSKAIALTSGTKIMTGQPTTFDNLEVGQRVVIDGRTEDSGVIAASQVVVSPGPVSP